MRTRKSNTPANDGASAAPHLRPIPILSENTKSHFLDSHLAPWASAATAHVRSGIPDRRNLAAGSIAVILLHDAKSKTVFRLGAGLHSMLKPVLQPGPRSAVIPALVADGVAHHSDPDQYATCLLTEQVGV
jgi:hypothetical protein